MRLRIGLVCIVLSALQAFAGTAVVPTTTLAAETGNNTSGAATFQAQSNGNIAPANVSKVATSSLLYSGSSTTIYAHFMPWFGVSYHMNVGYDSADPAQVKAQVTDMMSRGISGAIIDWYGPSKHNATALAMMKEAESRNGAFQFAIMEDAGSISGCANTSGCDLTGALIADLNYVTQTYANSPAYIKWNGNPVIFYFGVESYGIDWTRVRANTASNLKFVFQNTAGFTRTYSNAAFSWVQPGDVTASDPMALNYLRDFYSAAQQNPSRLPVGAAYKGFDDTLAGWGSNRHMQQQCGQTWLSTFDKANSMWSTADQLAWFQLVTWNDYEEATEIETGIDNCVSISASVTGSALNWSITGNENTIDHYSAFISADGQNLMALGDFPVGTRNVDLASFGIDSGKYSVFVKAVGKPSIRNHMSAAATYTTSATGLVVVLKATPNAGIAPVMVSASTAGSTDASGTIASCTIDFGDGTVASGLTATHNYANPGTYTIKATVIDSVGMTGSESAQINVTSAQPPVARLSVSPASGNAPVTVTATTASSTDSQGSALTSTIDFGDGTTSAGPTATHTYSNAGTFTVTATVANALKLQSQATATVSVSVPAALTVAQPANNATVAGPIHVVAGGSAPSGVDAMQIYLDHALVYQVNASSFDTTVPANPGAHLVVVKLWDKLGNAYSQSLNVTVGAALSTSLTATPSTIAAGGSVTATITATSGTMTSSQISWGDGATSAGPSASHVYAQAGSFTISSSANGNGQSSQATANVTVTAPASLKVALPANNSTVAGPIHVAASGSAPSGVDAMQIYLDGTLAYQLNASSFDTTVPANPGAHAITVKLWDKLGNAYAQSLNVTVAAPLAISLSAAPAAITSGGSVTATITATSGTMTNSQISWGDGATSAGASGSHVYTQAGTFTVSSTATSNVGTTAQATATVTVSAPAPVAAAVNIALPANNSSVSGPIHVVASGAAPSGVDAMQIYLDHALVYQVNASSFDTTVAANPGVHLVVVKLWDKLGKAYSQTINVTVTAAAATLKVALPANNATVTGPIHVTASGTAPSGVDAMQIYLDGSMVYQVNANQVNTTVAASTGTHSVVVKLWDKLGKAYTQPISVAVQ